MRINELEARESGLDYFLGKVVTVLLRTAARYPQSDDEFHKTYSGTVVSLTTLGLWIEAIQSNDRSFFFWTQVGGICQEEETTEDDPRIQAALQRKKAPPASPCGGGRPAEPPVEQLGVERIKGLTGKAKEEYERL